MLNYMTLNPSSKSGIGEEDHLFGCIAVVIPLAAGDISYIPVRRETSFRSQSVFTDEIDCNIETI